MRKLFSFFILTVILGIVAIGVKAFVFVTTPVNNQAQPSVFEVEPGSSFSKIAQQLEERSLVADATFFKILAKVKGQTGNVRVGEYELSAAMSPLKILSVVTSGKSIQRNFTVPEGENIFEIAAILEKEGLGSREEFLSLFKDKELMIKYLGEAYVSFEGYLFPETYAYTKYTKKEDVLEMMVNRFLQVWEEVGASDGMLNRHEIVTLASVVEKETGAPEERPVIASVFHNRLRKKMRLQSDPTILYGLLIESGKMKKNITKKDITKSTPYNTYTVRALPLGPIANPGKKAIEAVIKPGQSDFLYFVSRNDGTHVFSKTYEEHNKAVREYQLNRRARKGKSWRDLKNRKQDGSQRNDI